MYWLADISYLIQNSNKSQWYFSDSLWVSLFKKLLEFVVSQIEKPVWKAAVFRRWVWQHHFYGSGHKHTADILYKRSVRCFLFFQSALSGKRPFSFSFDGGSSRLKQLIYHYIVVLSSSVVWLLKSGLV